MTVLANVLYPAFMSPHIAAIFLPLSGLMAFAAEVLIYRHFNKGQYFWFIVWCVLFVNCVSSSFGMWLSDQLPDGYVSGVLGDGDDPSVVPGPNFLLFSLLGFLLAFILSVLIEWALAPIINKFFKWEISFKTLFLANLGSYLTLLVVASLIVLSRSL